MATVLLLTLAVVLALCVVRPFEVVHFNVNDAHGNPVATDVPGTIDKQGWQDPTNNEDPPPHGHGMGGHSRKVSGFSGRAGGSNRKLRDHQRGLPRWTHVLKCDVSVDVRDGLDRIAGTTIIRFNEARAYRININTDRANNPAQRDENFIVVFVTSHGLNQPWGWKRVYMILDSVTYIVPP
jgi:hypothetical protein